MVSSNACFIERTFTPMSSSSRAMGRGDSRHRAAILGHWCWRMGCSMEWMSYCARASSRLMAFSGVKPPLASTRNSICSLLYTWRMRLMRSSSLKKSMAPIFSFTQWNPLFSFSSSRASISS